MSFHPKDENEHLLAAVLIDKKASHVTFDETEGTLVAYDVKKHIVISYLDVSNISSSLLRFAKGGEQIFVVEGPADFENYR